MSDSKAYGPYAVTPIAAGGYLDIMKIRPVPAASDDIVYEITPSYTHRPDLLAYDLYGQKELWWIFAQRNLDVIKDPIYDFEPGTVIFLPKKTNLQKFLGV
jgi:hypothetical protein